MNRLFFHLTLLFAAFFVLGGCQSVQTTNAGAVGVARSQYMFLGISAAEIEQQYAKSYRELLIKAEQKNLVDYDSNNAQRVDRISERLIKQAPVFRADAAQWDWQIALKPSMPTADRAAKSLSTAA